MRTPCTKLPTKQEAFESRVRSSGRTEPKNPFEEKYVSLAEHQKMARLYLRMIKINGKIGETQLGFEGHPVYVSGPDHTAMLKSSLEILGAAKTLCSFKM